MVDIAPVPRELPDKYIDCLRQELANRTGKQMEATLIGVDCATDPCRVGLTLGSHSEGVTTVEAACLGAPGRLPADIILDWVRERGTPALIALDAPLGWPAPLAESLQQHCAGDTLQYPAHDLFRRHTDRIVRDVVGKQSLDVGADRIARTAYAALRLLGEVRHGLDESIPLAWDRHISGLSAIEVYPAATLAAHGIDATGYKAKHGHRERRQVLEHLTSRMVIETDIPDLDRGSDSLDAVICLLAAQDFLVGDALAPQQGTPVAQEGWIWVRDPS